MIFRNKIMLIFGKDLENFINFYSRESIEYYENRGLATREIKNNLVNKAEAILKGHKRAYDSKYLKFYLF